MYCDKLVVPEGTRLVLKVGGSPWAGDTLLAIDSDTYFELTDPNNNEVTQIAPGNEFLVIPPSYDVAPLLRHSATLMFDRGRWIVR